MIFLVEETLMTFFGETIFPESLWFIIQYYIVLLYSRNLSAKFIFPKQGFRFASAGKLICEFSRISRHLFSESQLFVSNILYKVEHTNLSIASFLSHFLKGTAYPMPVDVDKKVSFNHSILCCGRTVFNQSFFKNEHKTTHCFGQTSQNSP